MKRFFALLCAAAMVGVMLCSCTGDTAGKTKEKASEAVQDIKKDMKDSVTEIEKIETTVPTESPDDNMAETIMDAVETEWDDMVENGEVDDGDGNVGDAENNDGDGNTAPEN